MSEFQHILSGVQPGREQPPWAANAPPAPEGLPNITQRAIEMFMYSKQDNGEIGGIGWWQTANGYTAMALHDLYAHGSTAQNYNVLADMLRRCEARQSHFINEFNDDTLWWALCSLHLYSLGGDAYFLRQAQSVWQHVHKSVCKRGQQTFQGKDMEGAVFWTTKSDEEQINSITTGLMAELSLRLALVGSDEEGGSAPSKPRRFLEKVLKRPSHRSNDEYVQCARMCLGWIFRARFRAHEGIVLDNIMLRSQEARDWAFSYLTGQAIGACALLYEVTGDADSLVLACRMAHAAMRRGEWVDGDGTLTERGAYGKDNHQPGDNSDAVGFKSVLMRHLGTLYAVIARGNVPDQEARDTATLIRAFVNVNMRSQQERNTNGNAQYGPWWNGPFDMPTSHSQMAVLDVMAAARVVNHV